MKKVIPFDRALIARERATEQSGIRPRASVVVVVYNTPRRVLGKNLQALARQSIADFETIIVDNSDKKDLESLICAFPVRYFKLQENFGLCLARNAGIHFAEGEIVIFLDDDAIPARDFVEQHLLAHQTNDIAGLRGKSLPRSGTIYNRLAVHYDLGAAAFPFYINLEGNASFKKEILLEMGGFRQDLKNAGGYEGAELSFRIINHFRNKNKLIYFPGAVIYHDFCGSFAKYMRKLKRHVLYKKLLMDAYPGLFDFLKIYELPAGLHANQELSPLTRGRLWVIRKAAAIFLRLNGF